MARRVLESQAFLISAAVLGHCRRVWRARFLPYRYFGPGNALGLALPKWSIYYDVRYTLQGLCYHDESVAFAASQCFRRQLPVREPPCRVPRPYLRQAAQIAPFPTETARW